MAELYRSLGDRPEGPLPLVVVTEGWIEASETLTRVHEAIVDQADLAVLAEFDTDLLLDQRARRPTMTVVDGVVKGLSWPTIELAVGTDNEDSPFLLLHGPEPDVRWRPFAQAVTTLADSIGVTTMYTLGAYPAPAPHTRPVRVSTTASEPELLIGRDHASGVLVVPVGVHAAVAEELNASGTPTMGLWAQVPYYVSTNPWPQAAAQLLGALHEVTGLRFSTDHFESQFAEARTAVDSMLEDSAPLVEVVRGLEDRYDETNVIDETELPTGDELEAELQKYLRHIDDD